MDCIYVCVLLRLELRNIYMHTRISGNFYCHERFYRKFWCLDEGISLNGDYNSESGKSLVLEWQRCDPSSGITCKD